MLITYYSSRGASRIEPLSRSQSRCGDLARAGAGGGGRGGRARAGASAAAGTRRDAWHAGATTGATPYGGSSEALLGKEERKEEGLG